MKKDFCQILRVSTSSSLLYLFFTLYLLIRVWFSFGIRLSPLEKGHRSLEYQCSFVRLYLFSFEFWIISIETFCIFDYLY